MVGDREHRDRGLRACKRGNPLQLHRMQGDETSSCHAFFFMLLLDLTAESPFQSDFITVIC